MKVYVDRTVPGDGGATSLAEFLLPTRVTPFDFAMADDFMSALSIEERVFLDELTAGYRLKKLRDRTGFKPSRVKAFRTSVLEKAAACL